MNVVLSPAQLTEAKMLQLLRQRYTEKAGNGDAWAFVPHVRNAAGFNANRTADAVAMSLWPSRGLLLHGFEIKVSRADWLRELKNPAKADDFCKIVDRWWLVVADESIVQPGELPDTWGLLVAKGSRLICKTEAPTLHDDPPIVGRSFLAALLRSAARVSEATPAEVQEAVVVAREELQAMLARQKETADARYEALNEKVQAFQRESGVTLEGWHSDRDAAETGRLLKIVIDGHAEVERVEKRLEVMSNNARRLADEIDKTLGRTTEEDTLFP